MGLQKRLCDIIGQAAELHDIGKLIAPADMDQFYMTRDAHGEDHAVWDSLMDEPKSPAIVLSTVVKIAECHQEGWNGSGYPYGLREKQIPFEARIVALAVAFDQYLFRKRSSAGCDLIGDCFTGSKVADMIRAASGERFDPEIVDVFLLNYGDFVRIFDANS